MGASASGTINLGNKDSNPTAVLNNLGTALFSSVEPVFGYSVTGEYTVGSGNVEGILSVFGITGLAAGDITDVAGNHVDWTLNHSNIFTAGDITIDVTKPQITEITTNDFLYTDTPPNDDNPLAAGEQITVRLNFEDPVKLAGGDVTVTFNTGGTATIAPTPGVNDNHSVFQAVYTIGAGETI